MTALFAALLAASAAQAAPASGAAGLGVDEPPRRGTFVEASLGLFSALGGSAAFSAAQPYLGLTVGREVSPRAALFASLGIGAASASCYQLDPKGGCLGADSFGATFLELGGAWGMSVAPRTLLSLKALGGFTDLSPGPVRKNGVVPDHVPGLHLGTGFALDYDTRLDHFAVGIDAVFRYTFTRDSLAVPTLAVMPRIRYVF
ncbi:MAG TPA: adventurous gliding motility protein CglE [Myxococcales bacterium]|nr:adventurous gliding motility protein CglE [Myxococcales bacterium]